MKRSLFWFLFSLVTLHLSLHLGWSVLTRVDFFYPVCHDLLKIDSVVADYGPRNPIRKDFHLTTREERIRLFSVINDAVHQEGRGLEEIHYYSRDHRDLGPMLTAKEIEHLRDVATLLSQLRKVGWGSLLLWFLLLFIASKGRLHLPRLSVLGGGTLAGILAVVGLITLIGPVRVFYFFHGPLFSRDHQWFFYYEESLMTMLMRAPDLFGLIALEILGLGFLIWLALLFGTSRFVVRPI